MNQYIPVTQNKKRKGGKNVNKTIHMKLHVCVQGPRLGPPPTCLQTPPEKSMENSEKGGWTKQILHHAKQEVAETYPKKTLKLVCWI